MRATDSTVGLDAGLCEVDVDIFRRDSIASGASATTLDALARAAYAAGLYKGDLLEDWDLEWCRLEREQLRQRFVHTLRALAEGFERLRRYDLALQHARRAADADPTDEPAQRALIRLLFCTGDKTSAVSQFRRFAGYARSELGVEPDSQTMALFRQIKETSSGHSRHDSAEAGVLPARSWMIPLVGRAAEREQISALLDSVMAGTGGSILILGEAGVGKSKLTEWIMEEWAARGGRTTRGRCIEFNEPIPYQPILDAVGSVADVTGMMGFATEDSGGLPSLEEVAVGTGPHRTGLDQPWPAGKLRLFGWLVARLDEVSRRRPLLIVIEDLQWADASSVDFAAYLLEHARNLRLFVLVTARPSRGKIGQVVNIERLSRYFATAFRLHPLTAAETAELVRILLDRPRIDSDLARSIHMETEGNPLFIVETIRLMHQQQRAPQGEATAIRVAYDPHRLAGGSRIPDGVRSAVEQRLGFIDPTALRLARIASVLGRSFDEELLSTVAGGGGNRLSRAVSRLLSTGIFEREGAGYRFAHDKIRAVCYENLPARVRRVYHARAAAALSQIPDVPIHRLAWHQFSAGYWTLAAVSWERAGDHAKTVHAYEEALRAYQYAVTSVRRGHDSGAAANEKEIQILLKSDEVLAVLGRPVERRDLLDHVGALIGGKSKPSLRAFWHIRKALLEDHVGNWSLAAGQARRAWSVARFEASRKEEIEALQVLAFMLYRVERYRRSLAVSQLTLRKIGYYDSPSKVAALLHAAAVYMALGDYASTSPLLDRARGISAALGLRSEYYQVVSRQGLLDKWTGDVRASRTRFMEARRLAKEANDAIFVARVNFQLSSLDALEGRLGDAIQRLRETLVSCRALGHTRTQVSCLNEVAYGIGRVIGNLRWAWDASTHALGLPGTLDSRILSWMVKDSQAMLLLEEGRAEEAMRAINEVLRLVEPIWTSIPRSHPFLESLARRGVTWLYLRNPSQAIVDLETARRLLTETGGRLILVDALTSLALAYSSIGDAQRALVTSHEAILLLAEISFANYQPQRVFWHHYLILEKFNGEPRLLYLKRAVEFIEAQAATVSKAQARRLRRDVRLNREILDSWEQHKHELQAETRNEATTTSTLGPVTSVSASPAI